MVYNVQKPSEMIETNQSGRLFIMSRLDDLLIKAKDLANAAGNKAQEMAELTKLRLQAAQLRSDLDANYLKMGEIVYELKKADTENEDLIAMCIAEIDAQHRELEELNQKIDDLKNEVKCPECMASNPKDALYCSRCGAALIRPQEETGDEEDADEASETDDTDETPEEPEEPGETGEKPAE